MLRIAIAQFDSCVSRHFIFVTKGFEGTRHINISENIANSYYADYF